MDSVKQKIFYSIKKGDKTRLFLKNIFQAQLPGTGENSSGNTVFESFQNPSSKKSSTTFCLQ